MSEYEPPRPPEQGPPPGFGPPPGYPPPPPGFGPPPVTPPERPWWKRPWVIVVGVLVALVALGAVAGPGEDEEDGASANDGSPGTTLVRDPGDEEATTTSGPLGAELISSDDIEAGVCFDEPTTASSLTPEDDEADTTGTTEPETVFAIPALDCREPHLFEATGTHELEGDDDAFPGLEAMAAAAEAPCEAMFAEHVGVGSDESVHHSLPLLLPTEASWGNGGREAICVAEADDLAEIRGDVAGQGPTVLVDTVDLVVGDCFFDSANGDVVRVACDSPHDNEVVGFHTSPLGDPYPGADAITADGDPACAELFTELVGEDPDDSDVQVSALFFPTEASWAAGDRSVTCVAYADDLSLLDAPVTD